MSKLTICYYRIFCSLSNEIINHLYYTGSRLHQHCIGVGGNKYVTKMKHFQKIWNITGIIAGWLLWILLAQLTTTWDTYGEAAMPTGGNKGKRICAFILTVPLSFSCSVYHSLFLPPLLPDMGEKERVASFLLRKGEWKFRLQLQFSLGEQSQQKKK